MKEIFNFMKEFQKHHHKYWFSQNKERWKEIRSQFDTFMLEISKEVMVFDNYIQTFHNQNKKIYKIFRINRDIRFSKDKTPYKRNISGTIAVGNMGDGCPGYYISIEPGDRSFVGAGIHTPNSESLKRIRNKIDRFSNVLENIINKKTFKTIFPNGIDTQNKLITSPRGYNKDHPAIDLLRLKSFTAGRTFTDVEVLSENFKKKLIKTLKELQPLNEFLTIDE